MSDSRFFLGVDGGGTKTEFVCMNEGGQVVARTVTGTTYHLQVGYEEAVERIRVGVGGICAELAITPAAFAYAFFGLPAFGEDAMIDPLLDQACGRILGHDRYRCGNDMVCGWAGSLACEDGINLVAGTGSIGYGERRGRSARIGGWGEMFSDEGSAYWIAIRGLNAFTRMSDGRLPAGPLLAGFRQTLGLTNDLDLCAMIMGDQGMARDDVAGLAKIVSQAGEAGDIAACLILDDAGRELATMARSLRDILGFPADEATPLSWSGGVLTGQKLVSDALARHLGEGFVLIEPRHPPGNGAALYARLLGGR
jgi:N-acetylglucosamine kinase-like BadF-type ATPase